MGLLEVSLVGVSYATSRWTLTTTLFRAIKRINLSRGSKTCFYIYKRRLAIFMHFKTCDITRVSCVIYFLCLFYYCFYLLFSEDLTVVRIKGTNYCRKCITDDISSSCGFLYNCVTWRFLLMYFLSKVSASFLIFILAVVFFIVSFSRVYYLEFVSSFIPWLLDSILCVFS
jgi:hypothetical protein